MKVLFSFSLLFVWTGVNHNLEMRLPLLTTSFQHPTLSTWYSQFPSTNPPSSRLPGQDALGLIGNSNYTVDLQAAADSLANAHGFLAFNYGRYRISPFSDTEFYTMVDQDIGNAYQYAGPHIIYYPKFDNTNRIGLNIDFKVKWNGYDEQFDLPEEVLTDIERQTQVEAQSSMQSSFDLTRSEAKATKLFKELLDRALKDRYIIVDGKRYDHGKSVYLCKGTGSKKLTGRGFPTTGNQASWVGVDSTSGRFGFINLANVSASPQGRPITISCSTCEDATSVTINVVIHELDALEYYANNGWQAIPNTLSGICSQNDLLLRAIPNPLGVAWDTTKIQWSGLASGTGTQKNITPTASTDNNASQVSVSFCGNTISSNLSVQGLAFSGLTSERYAFDDNQVMEYGTFQYETDPYPGIPWKFIENGQTDILQAQATNIGESSINYAVGDEAKAGVTPNTSNQASLQLTLEGRSDNDTTALVATSAVGCELGQVKVSSHNRIEQRLAIVLVNEENDDLQIRDSNTVVTTSSAVCVSAGGNRFLDTNPSGDDQTQGDSVIVAGANNICETLAFNNNIAPNFTNQNVLIDRDTIFNALNRIYNKIGIYWTDVDFLNVTLNYDLDKNGLFDKDAAYNTYNSEMNAMVDNCGICRELESAGEYDKFIFFVDNIQNNNTSALTVNSFGRMRFGHNYGFIYPESPRSNQQFQKAIAHELGHGTFRLRHPTDHRSDNPYNIPGYPNVGETMADPTNLMENAPGGVTIRKYLWEIIHQIK